MNEHDDHYEHYSMIIEWSSEDQAYIVTVPELPGCRTHGFSYEEAVRQGQDAIDSWIMARDDSGRPVPPPRDFAERARMEEVEYEIAASGAPS